MPVFYPLARAGLFRLDPETAHEIVLHGLSRSPPAAIRMLAGAPPNPSPRLGTRIWGIDFPHPVGLAAGFDKGGIAFNSLAALGFGFVEIGTVTAHPQPGNPRPRLFRLRADEAILNRMGFNNPGAEAVARRLAGIPARTVLGVNVGKSKVTPPTGAIGDYLRSIELLEPFARYLVINVSSPNTPGLRALQGAGPLRDLLRAVGDRPRRTDGSAPPVLLKLAPDLSDPQLDEAVDVALEEGVDGIVAVNTTISREGLVTPRSTLERLGDGGISGRPLRARACAVVARIHRRTGGSVPIVGVGGIFTPEDAWERIRQGASLVQLYTGFVYQGPGLIRRVVRGLDTRLQAGGFSSLREAVGSAHRE